MMAPYDFPPPACPWCQSEQYVSLLELLARGEPRWICSSCRMKWEG